MRGDEPEPYRFAHVVAELCLLTLRFLNSFVQLAHIGVALDEQCPQPRLERRDPRAGNARSRDRRRLGCLLAPRLIFD